MRRGFGYLLFVLMIACSGLSLAAIEYKNCDFNVDWPQESRCGHFSSSRFSGDIRLPFFILGSHYKKTPLLYINGGPGSASGLEEGFIPFWLNFLDSTNLGRPLVVIDLPGTGQAQPKFQCEQLEKFNHWQLAAGLQGEELLKQSYSALKKCREHFLQAGDFRWLNTSNTASLLNDFITQFDAPVVDIYALSFGGRIALELQRLDNPKLGKLVLDSPYPPGRNLLKDWPEIFANAVNLMANSCKKNCKETPAEVEDMLAAILDSLNTRQQRKELDISGNHQSLVLGSSLLLDTLFFSLYQEENRNRIIPALKELSGNKPLQPALDSLLGQYVSLLLDPQFNLVTYYSLSCAGQKKVSPREYRKNVKSYSPRWSDYILSEAKYNICDIWPVDPEPKHFSTFPKSQRSTLVLLGSKDPVILPGWFDDFAAMEGVDVRLFPDASHVLFSHHYCAQQWVLHFLDEMPGEVKEECSGYSYQ